MWDGISQEFAWNLNIDLDRRLSYVHFSYYIEKINEIVVKSDKKI